MSINAGADFCKSYFSHQPIPGCSFGYAFDDIGNRKTA
jgi:hypothetical protein